MNKTQTHLLDCSAEQALSKGHINGMVICCYQNEKPLLGLAGLLDWQLNGALSYYLKKEVISGKIDECVYVPFQKLNHTWHFFLLGCGPNNTPGERQFPIKAATNKIIENMNNLGLLRIGISLSDFGQKNPEKITSTFKEVPFWIVH